MKLFYLPGNGGIPPDSHLVVGVSSYSNVGQLAVDCMLATVSTMVGHTSIKRIGSIESELVLPMTGYESFSANGQPQLCLSLEVYEVSVDTTNLYFILQRAPCVVGKQKQFAVELSELLMSLKSKVVFVLTGASTEDTEHVNNRLFSLATENCKAAIANIYPHINDWIRETTVSYSIGGFLESTDSIFKFPAGIDDSDSLKVQKILNCPKGMSVAALLYEELARRDEGTLDRVAVIGKCCPEGDNIFDGVEIAHAIMSYSNLFSSRNQSLSIQDMKCPASWSAMYGPKLTNDTMFY